MGALTPLCLSQRHFNCLVSVHNNKPTSPLNDTMFHRDRTSRNERHSRRHVVNPPYRRRSKPLQPSAVIKNIDTALPWSRIIFLFATLSSVTARYVFDRDRYLAAGIMLVMAFFFLRIACKLRIHECHGSQTPQEDCRQREWTARRHVLVEDLISVAFPISGATRETPIYHCREVLGSI
ncbi:hypothetical protein BXZ70DRAFT_282859 [Cristinia sonorae]|uniref:Uncharacterized protein n=1 Tax=Cristinia sonorae TaxID=1940300 RepID=A0A8K0V0P7_9AGAR|nr:hypothetical protein BXZ70DRAFT_282859 [Cristinia sonorae]